MSIVNEVSFSDIVTAVFHKVGSGVRFKNGVNYFK